MELVELYRVKTGYILGCFHGGKCTIHFFASGIETSPFSTGNTSTQMVGAPLPC